MPRRANTRRKVIHSGASGAHRCRARCQPVTADAASTRRRTARNSRRWRLAVTRSVPYCMTSLSARTVSRSFASARTSRCHPPQQVQRRAVVLATRSSSKPSAAHSVGGRDSREHGTATGSLPLGWRRPRITDLGQRQLLFGVLASLPRLGSAASCLATHRLAPCTSSSTGSPTNVIESRRHPATIASRPLTAVETSLALNSSQDRRLPLQP